MRPALFAEIPAAREHFPWVPVGSYPTRVERVGDVAGPDVGLWVKREDLGGARFGGNKVRKLEFIFGEAKARGAHRLVTFGSHGSSHVAATATYAPALGFELEALLFPEPPTELVRHNLEIVRASGARIRMLRHVAQVFPHRLAAQYARDTFWIAGGGSSPAGALGWVSGAFEILEQVRSGEMPRPAAVYVALGSGATFAGLCWGLRGDPPIEVVGVEVVEPAWWCRWQARRLVREMDRRLAPLAGASPGAPPQVRIVRGSRRVEDDAAISRAQRLGLSLDPVYTTPTLDALLRDVRDGRWRGRDVLFIDSLNGIGVPGR